MEEAVDNFEQKKYQLYIDERKLLIQAEQEGARTFDKAILTFASGSFGVSIAFIKDVVPHPYVNTLWLLGTSWALFSICLITILFSFLASQNACKKNIDLAYQKIMNAKEAKNQWSTITLISNYFSLIFLTLAFIVSGCFVYWNLIH